MTLYIDQFPGPEAYNFPITPKHESPCMNPFWRNQTIRQGMKRDEIEHDEKEDDEE